ncbi:hypothetical protein DPMN_086421 [Dreissena polymorpha]|uniref:Uncharacterized protein n=1 Tax=Dreissena polymorpha TaxID=45954 RepID=A0A9D4KS86_DREPO|nr:hypothetical protein DPMN_086421 [Dreissena polymorpha]
MHYAQFSQNVAEQNRANIIVSIQTMKLKVADDAPWKDAAKEIVGMLKNVRSESADGNICVADGNICVADGNICVIKY